MLRLEPPASIVSTRLCHYRVITLEEGYGSNVYGVVSWFRWKLRCWSLSVSSGFLPDYSEMV